MHDHLIKSCESGDLEKALQSASKVVLPMDDTAVVKSAAMAPERDKTVKAPEALPPEKPPPPEEEPPHLPLSVPAEESFEPAQGPNTGINMVEEAKMQMKTLLEKSYLSGKLDEVLDDRTNVENSEIFAAKAQLRSLLENSVQSGRLDQILNDVAHADGVPDVPQQNVGTEVEVTDVLPGETAKARLRDSLLISCESGELDRAVREAMKRAQIYDGNGDANHAKIGAAKVRMRSLLEESINSGKLNEVVREVTKIEDDVDRTRMQIKALLASASHSGELESALEKEERAAEDIAGTKARMQNILEHAYDTGEWERVIQEVMAETEATNAATRLQNEGEMHIVDADTSRIEQLKRRMRKNLWSAYDSGKLDIFLTQVMAIPMDSAKSNLKSALVSGCQTGALHEALDPHDVEIQKTKAQLRKWLSDALDSGELELALKNSMVLQEKPEAPSGEPELSAALDSGAVEPALKNSMTLSELPEAPCEKPAVIATATTQKEDHHTLNDPSVAEAWQAITTLKNDRDTLLQRLDEMNQQMAELREQNIALQTRIVPTRQDKQC